VATPLLKPWFVTNVSCSNTTGVSDCRYPGICSGRIFRTVAQAFALSGFAARKLASSGTSHSPSFPEPPNNSLLVAFSPPYRLSLVPLMVSVPVFSSRVIERADPVATDSTRFEMDLTGPTPFVPVNGSGPTSPTASRVTMTSACGG